MLFPWLRSSRNSPGSARRPVPLTVEPLDERTVPSATMVAAVGPIPQDPSGSLLAPSRAVSFHGLLYFATGDGHTGGLYRSDGTAAGTGLVAAVPAADLTVAGSTLFFFTSDATHGERLWTSDGTPAGTVAVTALPEHAAAALPAPPSPVSVGRTLFFTVDDGIHGWELWKSDGTVAGTWMVRDINPGAASADPRDLTVVGGTLFFTAVEANGARNLWTSDGTWRGTVRVGVISPSVVLPVGLPNVNGTLFFSTWAEGGDIQLWKSDGTTTTSLMHFKESVTGLTNVNGTLIFLVLDGTGGDQVWESNGTTAGTKRVAVASLQDATTGTFLPFAPVNVNGTFYFTADDSTKGNELWKSDGTPAGTTLLKVFGGSPSWPTVVGGTLYFTADDRVHGPELWRTDGTAAGTVMVQDINPGAGGSNPQDLTVVNGTLYFVANAGTPSSALWKVGPSATGAPVAAQEGQTFTGTVATFSDADVRAGAGTFTATITWGDGHTSAGGVAATGHGNYTVVGSHIYAEEGSYAVGVAISHAGGTATATGTAKVGDAPLMAAPAAVTSAEGAPFTGVVAVFTDADLAGTANDYSATIAWGDGQSSAGSIAPGRHGSFAVTGTHAYAEGGSFAVTVTIKDAGGSAITVNGAAKVHDAALTAAGRTITPVTGTAFAGVVASFTGAAPSGTASEYTATITWGAGHASAGTVAADGHGGFTVSGTHTYVADGVYPVTVTIHDVGGASATVLSVAEVGGVATRFGVSVSTAATAGVPFGVSVNALDALGNPAYSYTGSVHFTSSDAQAVLPADAIIGGDAGGHIFNVTLKTAGQQTVTVAGTGNGSVAGKSGSIQVKPADATHYRIDAPATAIHGVAFSFAIAALDAFGNVATGYRGTVSFTSSDGAARLPATYTFIGGDAGVHAFAATLNTLGTASLTVTDTKHATMTDTDADIAVPVVDPK